MSLDDRLRTALRSEPETPVDPALELDRFYARAKPRRARRQVLSGVMSLLLLAAVAAGALRLADLRGEANFAEPPLRVASARPAPEELRRAAGVEQAYPVARGTVEGRSWEIWAYDNGDKPCLWRGGLDVSSGSCWAGGFELQTGLDAGAMSTGEPGKPTLHVFDGYAPIDVATIRITARSGESVDVPTVRMPEHPLSVYATALVGDQWVAPVRYTLLDARGRDVSAPMCTRDQYTLRFRRGLNGRPGQRHAEPTLGVEGLRGRLACRMALDASLVIEGPQGRIEEIRGNGAVAGYHAVVHRSTTPLGWMWVNWCGQREQLRYVVRVGDQVVATAPVTQFPSCIDPTRVSSLTPKEPPPSASAG